MICSDCQCTGRKPAPGATTSQTPGVGSWLGGYCDACGCALASRWHRNVRPGPKASETVEDRGFYEYLPERDRSCEAGGAIATLLGALARQ